MNRNVIVQSIGDHPRDAFAKYMGLELPIHRDYAARCGADFEFFVGQKDPRAGPTWSRLPMILDAFAAGHECAVWMDADVLVVNPDRKIFEEVTGAPLHMTRTEGFPWWTPDGEQEAWNDGVLVVEKCDESIAALEWVWARRHDPFLPHQMSGMPELSFLLDYVFSHPDGLVKELPRIWNSNSFAVTGETNESVVIEAFHGMPHEARWSAFQACYQAYYGS